MRSAGPVRGEEHGGGDGLESEEGWELLRLEVSKDLSREVVVLNLLVVEQASQRMCSYCHSVCESDMRPFEPISTQYIRGEVGDWVWSVRSSRSVELSESRIGGEMKLECY